MQTPEDIVVSSLALRRCGVPIYVQIREQLLRAISAGTLVPGARLPTMRQVAVALKVDLNTVRHAYEDLRQDGLIDLRQGLGSFVVQSPPLPAADIMDDLAHRVMAEALVLGLDPTILAGRITDLMLKEISR